MAAPSVAARAAGGDASAVAGTAGAVAIVGERASHSGLRVATTNQIARQTVAVWENINHK